MRSRLIASIAVVALVLAACSSGASPSAPASAVPSAAGGPARVDLMIYGASSLKAALAKIRTAYEGANPGRTLTIATDSSTALETKIEQGAPADVFLSADTKNPQKLVDGGFATGPVTKFSGNLLTVIVPAGNPAGIKSPADLAQAGVKIIASADDVPIAKYAAQLVANLAKLSGYPADFAAKYTANVASKEDNVAAVVSKVELGEGDAGIVYVTDATSSGKVARIPIPDGADVPATYGGVVMKASPNVEAANAFLAWLAGPDGQAILASLGFLPPA